MNIFEWTSPEGFRWLDIANPSEHGLRQVAKQFDLPRSVVKDCLQPDHLPKYENIRSAQFVILRAFDERAPAESDTTQELTRKIAIFKTDEFLISIHRKDQPFISDLRKKVAEKGIEGCPESEKNIASLLLLEIMKTVILTFEKPVQAGLAMMEDHEARIFGVKSDPPYSLQEGYVLRRRGVVFRRIVRLSQEVYAKVISSDAGDVRASILQDIREEGDRMSYQAEDLLEGASSLLNMHISLSSQRTNEIVRLLTVFSVFFLPLNFVAGLYGMNFENIPGAKLEFGFHGATLSMTFIAVGIYYWMRRQGWIK